MLGRLRMTVPACIDAFEGLSEAIFGHSHLLEGLFTHKGRYSASNYIDQAKKILRQQNHDENALMTDDYNPCKV